MAWLNRLVLSTVFVLLLLVVSTGAAAASEARERAVSAFDQAERDDVAFELARAVAGYDEALRLDPSMPKAMRAEQRAAAIRARSEGGFQPLVALERVRRDPKLASDPNAIDDLVRRAETFPSGLVRIEVWVLAAEAYTRRLDRPADAVGLWRRIIVDPQTDPITAAAAARSLATYHLARRDIGAAEEAVALAGPKADATLARDVERVARRRTLHLGAIGTIAVAVVAAAVAFTRARKAGRLSAVIERARASSVIVFAYAAYVAIGGAVLATGYEEGTARPFLLFGAVLVPLLLLARAWGAAGAATGRARGLRAGVCAASALAAAFLVLEHVDVAYLEGLGL
jgi:hypothetical protein